MTAEKDRIEEEIAETLGCFQRLETIEPSPYFYTRLEARFERFPPAGRSFAARIFTLGVPLPALLACLLVFNLCAAALLSRGNSPESETREERLSALAREYHLIQETNGTGTIIG